MVLYRANRAANIIFFNSLDFADVKDTESHFYQVSQLIALVTVAMFIYVSEGAPPLHNGYLMIIISILYEVVLANAILIAEIYFSSVFG